MIRLPWPMFFGKKIQIIALVVSMLGLVFSGWLAWNWQQDRELLALAQEYTLKVDLVAAERAYQHLLERNPRQAQARVEYAGVLVAGARILLEQVTSITDEEVRVRQEAAAALAAAAAQAERAVALKPKNAAYWNAYAQVLLLSADLEKERLALTDNPKQSNLIESESGGALPRAARAALTAATLNPSNLDYRLLLADIYFAANLLPEAEQLYQQILDRDPTYAIVIVRQAQIQTRLDQTDLAYALYHEALEYTPTDSPLFAQITTALQLLEDN